MAQKNDAPQAVSAELLKTLLTRRKLVNRWVDLGCVEPGKIGITYFIPGMSLYPQGRDGVVEEFYKDLPFGKVVVHEVDPGTGETVEGPVERLKRWAAVEHVINLWDLKWLPKERIPLPRRANDGETQEAAGSEESSDA